MMRVAGTSGRRQPTKRARWKRFLALGESSVWRRLPLLAPHASVLTSPAPRSGFTLIETMAVILIIVLAVGVGMPSFLRVYRGEILRGETRKLRATIQHARYQAIVRQHTMMLNLDFSQQAYWIEMPDTVETNMVQQVLNLSTNALAFTDGTFPDFSSPTNDLSTNAVILALPDTTHHDMVSPARLVQLEALDGTVNASGVASIAFYPNGACQGGAIFLGGSGDDRTGIELDPLTSLSKLMSDAQTR